MKTVVMTVNTASIADHAVQNDLKPGAFTAIWTNAGKAYGPLIGYDPWIKAMDNDAMDNDAQ